ncbi:IS1096 element passenger TnpR family protein [Desulfobacula sp.]
MPAGITLDRLHDVIQIVMGWTDSHLHEFTIGKKRYTEYPESKEDGLVCGRYRIGELIKYLRWSRDRYQNWGGLE